MQFAKLITTGTRKQILIEYLKPENKIKIHPIRICFKKLGPSNCIFVTEQYWTKNNWNATATTMAYNR